MVKEEKTVFTVDNGDSRPVVDLEKFVEKLKLEIDILLAQKHSK